MADRILTTHTGSLPRTAKVVELLLAEEKSPGTHRAELQAAVREAVAGVVRKQVECGLDIINDGEQGRTDYTVHVLKRLTGYEGESAPPMGTGEPEFPELAEILKHFASPFQHRPACNGPVGWKDWPAAQADIDLAKAALQGAKAEDIFMTSPSPGQIARYLKNRYYKTDEEYIYALADVMRREYQAIVEAGFILQLDCPDLAMLRHMVYLNLPLADYRKIISRQCRRAQPRGARPAARTHAHACVLGLDHGAAPHRRRDQGHHRHRAVGPPACGFVPGGERAARARMEGLARREAAGRQENHSGRDRFHDQRRRASGSGRRPHPEFRKRGRARERHRRRRLRLRHFRRPRAGRHQDRLAQASVAGRGRAAGVKAACGRRRPSFRTIAPASPPGFSAALLHRASTP